jgi:predicted RNase H-like HicB family nuclease
VSLTYPVILKKSEEGYAVGCPALPGCWSQGVSEAEALQNIRIAIGEYLSALRELTREEDTREVEVTI